MSPGRPTHHDVVHPTPVRPIRDPWSEAQRECISDLVPSASDQTVTSVENRDSVAEIAIGVRESCPAAALEDRPIGHKGCMLIPGSAQSYKSFELLAAPRRIASVV